MDFTSRLLSLRRVDESCKYKGNCLVLESLVVIRIAARDVSA